MSSSGKVLEAMVSLSGQSISASALFTKHEVASLRRSGLLENARMPESIQCRSCMQAHEAPLILHEGRPHGVCVRTGDIFAIDPPELIVSVNERAIANAIADALRLDGETSPMTIPQNLWFLGSRRFNGEMTTVYLMCRLGRIDTWISTLDAVSQRSRGSKSVLIIGSGFCECDMGLRSRVHVFRLVDLAQLTKNGRILIDDQVLSSTLANAAIEESRRGRPPNQRERILAELAAMAASEIPVSTSAACIAHVISRFQDRPPGKTTVREAILVWLADKTCET